MTHDTHSSSTSAASDPDDAVETDGGTAEGVSGPYQDVLSHDALAASYPDYQDQVVETRRLEKRPAKTVSPSEVLRDRLADAMANDLFSHQAEALERLADGQNVVTTTSTSSGKTWIYALQAARNHLDNPNSTTLCIYPMKALARNQEAELNNKLREDWGLDLTVGVYDGDTPQDRKQRVREQADLIITNPAGLNAYLPRHNKDSGWHRVYSNLELVVVDEAHEYGGVTGTHVAWIVRRLRRLIEHYDADPQFSLTTATIGNPDEHAARLTGVEFDVVDEDGSPRGQRDIVLWEPPIDWDSVGSVPDESAAEDETDIEDFEEARLSTGTEAAKVAAHLGVNGMQTLQFCTARQGTEIAAKQIGEAATDHTASGYVSVESYHAGLGKQTRRAVENQLRGGDVDVVASTNALELGIDIGSLDATVSMGYPGTRQSFWQQSGRAGRGTANALSVLVGGMDAMDSYILDNSDYLFSGDVEDAVVTITNDYIYSDHLLAAANERPLTGEDAGILGGEQRFRETVAMWQDLGALDPSGRLDAPGGVIYTGDRRPQSRLSLYGSTGREYEVVCQNGEIDHDPVSEERAYREYHEGALFLHAGQQYEVLGIEHGRAYPRIIVESVQTGMYTQTLSQKWISTLRPKRHRSLDSGIDIYFGQGSVDVTYNEYLVREISTGDVIRGPLPTGSPSLELETDVLWVSLPEGHIDSTLERLDEPLLEPTERADRDKLVPAEERKYTYGGGIHAAEHGVIQLSPLELLIDNNDIGGLSTTQHSHETIPGPVWFVHDGIDGGIGFTESIYENFETILRQTKSRLANCDCANRRGCPLCVMSEDCGNNNDPLDRATADIILGDVLDAL